MGFGGRLRTRWRSARIGIAVSTVAVAAGSAAIAVWPHAWSWLAVVTGVVATGAPATLAGLAADQQRRAETAKAVRHELQGTTGSGDILPVVSQADLSARIHRAVLELPYIPRDAEDEARAHLGAGRPVLLVGSSMVGKTRMAATLIVDMYPTRRIIIPDTQEALSSLDASDVVIQDSVVFLDDINRLIGAGGMTDGALGRFVTSGNIIVGTIRAVEYDRFQPTDQLRPLEWDVLSIFERVFITRDLSHVEQQRLADAVDDFGICERIQRVGLGEYVGAAGRIAETLRLGPAVSPAGFALVLGAADWYRAGMSGPVPRKLLSALASPYLTAGHHHDLVSAQHYETALTWATREINPTVALLQEPCPDMFSVYDYALDIISSASNPIPDTSWDVLIANGSPTDLISIGYSAQAFSRTTEITDRAWREAADSGDPTVAAMAAFNLGFLLRRRGDLEGSRAAYERAIASGHHHQAPKAAINLGIQLAEAGDMAGARAAFETAIASRHENQTPKAMYNLGVLLDQHGDVEGARAAYQQAINSGHSDEAPAAAVNLGNMLSRHGNMTGAQAAYQVAVDSGLEHYRSRAWIRLGGTIEEQREVEAGVISFHMAIASGEFPAAPYPDAARSEAVGQWPSQPARWT